MSENSDGLYHHHSLSRAHQKLQTHSWLFTFTSHTLQISKFFLNRSHHFPYPLFPITYIWVFFLFGIVITGFLQIVPHRLQQFPFWNTNLTMKKKPFAKTLQWLPIADSLKIKCLKISHRDFLGGPVAKKTLCSECRKLGFTSWSVELDPTCHSWHSQINLKEKKKKTSYSLAVDFLFWLNCYHSSKDTGSKPGELLQVSDMSRSFMTQ